MNYKQAKKENEPLVKLRIIRKMILENWTNVEIAESFGCHRNTLSNIMDLFEAIDINIKQELLYSSLSNERLEELGKYLIGKTTKPHSHPAQVSPNIEDIIIKEMESIKHKPGPEKMILYFARKFHVNPHDDIFHLADLKIGQMKGVFKRNNIKVTKIKTKSGARKAIYDYEGLKVFEQLHYDTKHIVDQKALPPDIYEHFSRASNRLPIYEWNIICAKTRFRFIAYSRNLSAELGLRFLILVLQYLKSSLNINYHINIQPDNGMEFMAGSEKKLIEWNSIIEPFNASLHPYPPGWCVKKNIIERSHRSDDEELFVPLGKQMKTPISFMEKAQDYTFYWNFQRPHSGIGMNNLTPFEKVCQSNLSSTHKLALFPTLLLDNHMNEIRACTEPILCLSKLKDLKSNTKQKTSKLMIKNQSLILSRVIYF